MIQTVTGAASAVPLSNRVASPASAGIVVVLRMMSSLVVV
jgi:hypothetical protein